MSDMMIGFLLGVAYTLLVGWVLRKAYLNFKSFRDTMKRLNDKGG